MFMGPCILVYNDHINKGRDAAFYAPDDERVTLETCRALPSNKRA